MNDEKPSSNLKHRSFWILFTAAMGCFVAYNLYEALKSFGVIE